MEEYLFFLVIFRPTMDNQQGLERFFVIYLLLWLCPECSSSPKFSSSPLQVALFVRVLRFVTKSKIGKSINICHRRSCKVSGPACEGLGAEVSFHLQYLSISLNGHICQIFLLSNGRLVSFSPRDGVLGVVGKQLFIDWIVGKPFCQ